MRTLPHPTPADLQGPPADHRTLPQILAELSTTPAGLGREEAARRLVEHGANRLSGQDGAHPLAILLRQFRSPLVLILLAAAALSYALGEATEASIVAAIVLASSGLGFYQEYRADSAVADLRRRIAVSAAVWRDGRRQDIPAADLVPGDIVLLTAGSLVSADAVLLEATQLHIDEAALTGESFPVAKQPAAPDAPVGPDSRLYMGTSVRSGEGRALVVETGLATEFGAIAASVAQLEPETSFSRGIRRFGMLMTQIMLVMVVVVLTANLLLGRPVLDSLLFAAALAVGLTPELLPAIVTVTLARGAKRLAESGVLVRRLVAIENFGAMDTLCTDKTGTLTLGSVSLERALDASGNPSDIPLRWGMLNASLQTGLPNPLDNAIVAAAGAIPVAGWRKLAELPYDFERRRLSLLLEGAEGQLLVCKGAVGAVLPICASVVEGGQALALSAERRATEEARLAAWSSEGLRVLAVATRAMPGATACAADDEAGLTLVGYLLFTDPLKPNIAQTVAALRERGIGLKVLTGDNRYVAAHLGHAVGLHRRRVATGDEIARIGEHALMRLVAHVDVFAEVTPGLKERIIAALRKSGRTVGYLGDGINDAPALRAADVGISVDTAADAAKAAADIVLLEADLGVLLQGVIAGRSAFGNTLKYIAITISANLGNMISMALATMFLPFLPMLAIQILLNNSLSDLPMLAISTDRMDEDAIARPINWNFRALMRSMLSFGLMSSLFDGVTFVVLLKIAQANASLFQTGWFLESLLTELAVVAVMRTAKPFYMSRPSLLLTLTSLAVAVVAAAIPYTPLAADLGFVALPPMVLALILAIVLTYVLASELLKRRIGVFTPDLPGPSAAGFRARGRRHPGYPRS